MVVGISQIELHLPECRSLKDKRQIIRSILKRTQAHFHVSIAEVDHQSLWQRASIGISCVSRTGYQAKRLLHQITTEIKSLNNVAFLGDHVAIVNLEDFKEQNGSSF